MSLIKRIFVLILIISLSFSILSCSTANENELDYPEESQLTYSNKPNSNAFNFTNGETIQSILSADDGTKIEFENDDEKAFYLTLLHYPISLKTIDYDNQFLNELNDLNEKLDQNSRYLSQYGYTLSTDEIMRLESNSNAIRARAKEITHDAATEAYECETSSVIIHSFGSNLFDTENSYELAIKAIMLCENVGEEDAISIFDMLKSQLLLYSSIGKTLHARHGNIVYSVRAYSYPQFTNIFGYITGMDIDYIYDGEDVENTFIVSLDISKYKDDIGDDMIEELTGNKTSQANGLYEIIKIDSGESRYDLDGDGKNDAITFDSLRKKDSGAVFYSLQIGIDDRHIEYCTDPMYDEYPYHEYFDYEIYLCDIDNSDNLLDLILIVNYEKLVDENLADNFSVLPEEVPPDGVVDKNYLTMLRYEDGQLLYNELFNGTIFYTVAPLTGINISQVDMRGDGTVNYTDREGNKSNIANSSVFSPLLSGETAVYSSIYEISEIENVTENSNEQENNDSSTNEGYVDGSFYYMGLWEVIGTTEYYYDSSECWYIRISDDYAYVYDSVDDLYNDNISSKTRIEYQTDGTAHFMLGESSTSGNIPSQWYGNMWIEYEDLLMIEGYRDTFILQHYVEQ